MELKHAFNLVRGLRQALGLTDTGGLERVGEALQPTINMWEQPEWRALRGEVWAMGRQNVSAGGAGNRSQCGIWNPAGNNMLVIVRKIIAQQNSNINFLTATLGNIAQVWTQLDSRLTRTWILGTGLRSQWVYQNSAGVMGYHRAYFPATMVWDEPLILAPGIGVAVDPGGDNIACAATIVWSERPMLPGESVGELR